MFSRYFPIIFWCNLAIIKAQSDSIGWQSFISLSGQGMKFSPKNIQALLISDNKIDSIETCSKACHANILCRIFDFDGQTSSCRLFEGDADIMGSIILSSSSQSMVGLIQLISDQFASKGFSCSFCTNSRYLTCINSTCQCPSRTYFDGSICRSQNIRGGQCINSTDCRADLNLTCLSRKQCAPISVQNGVTVAGYSNGTAGNTSDTLFNPFGIAVGNDDSLYVSGFQNARVTRFPVGSLIGTVVVGTGVPGNGLNQLNQPAHLYVDAASNIYISDLSNKRAMLWRNGSSTGTIAAVSMPNTSRIIGIAVDSQKNVYVAETDNHYITKWGPNATNRTIVAGTGTPGGSAQQLNYPCGIYLDELNSHLYVADYLNNRIQRFKLGVSLNGTTVAGGNGQGSNDNQLYYPQGLCVSKTTGAIYIADTYNDRITRWYPGATSGVTIVGIPGSPGTTATLLHGPSHVALSQNETYLYVSDLNNNRIQRFELI